LRTPWRSAPAPALPTPAVVASAPAPAPAAAAASAAAEVATGADDPTSSAALLDNPMHARRRGCWWPAGRPGPVPARSRKKAGGETSFLESRLQPDSFFGASGGQRIDTREARVNSSSAASSSMSYSLSQLDAIGDVDPVAEADVYLAYGRDLQAEEILKEAMRANPQRMAIRTKLLEVYAKRRDIKGFELLATQVHSLTKGEGEDWARSRKWVSRSTPTTRCTKPGGQPEPVQGAGGQQVLEPLGASTMPHTATPPPPVFTPDPKPDSPFRRPGSGPRLLGRPESIRPR
jgi:pilus assembly protein FimV